MKENKKELIKNDAISVKREVGTVRRDEGAMKRAPELKYKVIKISKAAIYEFLYEKINEDKEKLFDITANTSGKSAVLTRFEIDWELGEFVAIAANAANERQAFEFDGINAKLLLGGMSDTTATMFDGKPYKEFTADELHRLERKQHRLERRVERADLRAQRKNEKKQRRDEKRNRKK